MNKAFEYTYGDRDDFHVALIPFQTGYGNCAHWYIGIYDRRGSGGRNWLYFYDPKKTYGNATGKILPEHRDILKHTMKTLHPGTCSGKQCCI